MVNFAVKRALGFWSKQRVSHYSANINPAAGHKACVDIQIYVMPPLCLSVLVCVGARVFVSELRSAGLQFLRKADTWSK